MKPNNLIEENLDLVQIVLKSNFEKAPFCYMDKEELMSAGNFGLVKAAHKYKEDKNASFRTYASPRVLGEMRNLDRELRWGSNHAVVEELNESHDIEDESCRFELFYEKITTPLDSISKKAFLLHYRDRYTLSEVAEMLDMGEWGESRVCKLIAKSKKIIRETYQSYELFSVLR